MSVGWASLVGRWLCWGCHRRVAPDLGGMRPPGSMTRGPARVLPCPSQWFSAGLVPLAAGGSTAAQLAGAAPGDQQPDEGMEKGKPQAAFVFLSDT